MFEFERPTTDSFEASDHFEWADRLGSAKLDGYTRIREPHQVGEFEFSPK
jgi:hypothetical protein